jgi:uncharacterized protein
VLGGDVATRDNCCVLEALEEAIRRLDHEESSVPQLLLA